MASPLPVEACLGILALTPSRLAELSAPLGPGELETGASPGDWSIAQILGHLRACQDTWAPWIRRIVTEESPTWRDVSARATSRTGDYLTRPFADALPIFTSQRAELLDVLRALEPDAWTRTARVRRAGVTYQRSIHHYASRMAAHEQEHVVHIEGSLAPG